MNTMRQAVLERVLAELVAAIDAGSDAVGGADGARQRLHDAAAAARALVSRSGSEGRVGHPSAYTQWFLVEAGDCWDPEVLRCPACGGRDGFWTLLDVRIGADSHPQVVLPIVHAPTTPIECARCLARAPYNDFLPPWSDFPPRPCTCAGSFCRCPLPLTDTDRAEEGRFMVERFAAGLDVGNDRPLDL
jgi:hypothetical protein